MKINKIIFLLLLSVILADAIPINRCINTYDFRGKEKPLTPVIYVTGKPISYFDNLYGNGHFFSIIMGDSTRMYVEKDSSAAYYFMYKNNRVERELIVPKDNKMAEYFMHYFNTNAMDYRRGGAGIMGAEHYRKITGQWSLSTPDGLTHIYMSAGEISNPMYFLNTTEDEPYWFKK